MCNLWLPYGKNKCTLEGYTNMDGSMAEDSHAITGYAFLINGRAVSWSLRYQEIMSLSIIESKYVTVMHGGKEGLWLCSPLSKVFNPIKTPTTLFSDIQAAIVLTCDHQ